MRTAFPRFLLPCAALVLAACGDGSVRSPDLPPVETELIGIGAVACSYPNGSNSIAVGQTAQCQVVGGCTYRETSVNPDGSTSTRTFSDACPDLSFGSSSPGIGSVDSDTGVVTGVSPGQTEITASGGGLTSPGAVVTVNGACGESLAVTPATATIISGPNVGTSQLYTATLTLSNGQTANVSTVAQTTWTSSNTSAARFTANQATAQPGLSQQTAVTVTASYAGNVCPGAAPLTGTAALTVRPAQLLSSGGLCLETVPPAEAFTGCRTDTGACQAQNETIQLNIGQSTQLQVRGRFDSGEECNVTLDSTLSTADAAVATVDDAALLTGEGAGNTTTSAGFSGQTATRPVTVVVNQVLGKNSLVVFSKQPYGDSELITLREAKNLKFACVGANNLVVDGLGGRTPRGALKAFALKKTCAQNALDSAGNCTAPVEGGSPTVAAFEEQTLTHASDGVTNPAARSADPLDDGIVWRSIAGYWNGPEEGCVAEQSNPSGRVGDASVTPRELLLGSDGTPVEPADGAEGSLQPNGLVYADAAVRVGFNCVTAEYENPENSANTVVDGMTVLVLPATNDILLGGSNDGYQLCDTLAPLFGTEPLLGLVETTNVLSAITSGLSPLLEQLDAVPIDSLVTQLQAGLSLLTAPLIDLLDPALVDPVLEPLVCEVTTAVNLLLGLLTGTTPEQACEEPPPDPAP